MAGRVDEHDLAVIFHHVIGADMLGDAAGFLFGDVGQTNGVEQRGLAVIDVAHDGHHRGALDTIGFNLGFLHVLHRFLLEADGVDGGSKIPGQLVGQLGIEGLVDSGEDIAVHQLLAHQAGFDIQLFGKLFDRDALGDGDLARDGRGRGGHFPARGPAQHSLFALRRTLAALRARAALIRRTALLDAGGRRLHTQRRARSGMHRARPHRPGPRRARTCRRASDRRRTGADGSFVNRLPGNWSALRPHRHAGARRGGLPGDGWFRLR